MRPHHVNVPASVRDTAPPPCPLSSLDERADHRLMGGVVEGDLIDDGCDVHDEVLAQALASWRVSRGVQRDTVALLEHWRHGEPWAEWLESAIAGWREARARAWNLAKASLAVALARHQLEREQRALRAALAAAEAARLAYEADQLAATNLVDLITQAGRTL